MQINLIFFSVCTCSFLYNPLFTTTLGSEWIYSGKKHGISEAEKSHLDYLFLQRRVRLNLEVILSCYEGFRNRTILGNSQKAAKQKVVLHQNTWLVMFDNIIYRKMFSFCLYFCISGYKHRIYKGHDITFFCEFTFGKGRKNISLLLHVKCSTPKRQTLSYWVFFVQKVVKCHFWECDL